MADVSSRKRGWRWSFIPRRLLKNERFLRLSHVDANILLRLYVQCSGYGRFEAGTMRLAITLGILDRAVDLMERIRHLEEQGFLFVYSAKVGGHEELYGQITNYDEDAPGELIRKRGPAILPSSGQLADEGRTQSAENRGEEMKENRGRASSPNENPYDNE